MFSLLKILLVWAVVWHSWLHSNRQLKPTSWGERPCLLEKLRHSVFQVLKPQLFLAAPVPSLHPTPIPPHGLISAPQAPRGVLSAECERVCLFALFFIGSLHFTGSLLPVQLLPWLAAILSASSHYPLTTFSSFICPVPPGLPTNGLYLPATLAKIFFSLFISYLDNSLNRHVPTNGNSSIVYSTYLNLSYWIFSSRGILYFT